MKHILFNIILFKIGWVSVVLGATYELAWLGSILVGVIALTHLVTASLPWREAILLGIAAFIGFIWESLLVSQNILIYIGQSTQSTFAPYWIVVMWILFATTLNISLRWLKRSWLFALFFGAVGSVLSFMAGEHIGAVYFPDKIMALTVISLGWAVLVPLIVHIANNFDGHYPERYVIN